MTQSEHQKIGKFIKKLREQRGMTQEAFAKALKTSQSAVARMEKGERNFYYWRPQQNIRCFGT